MHLKILFSLGLKYVLLFSNMESGQFPSSGHTDPPPPLKVYKSPILNLVLLNTFGGAPPPSKSVHKSQYQCWWSSILLHHLSYTTDTILPGLGTAHACWHSAKSPHKLAFGHNNPTVCSLACCWRLQSALRAHRESFSIDNPRGQQLKARLYSSELSYRTGVLQLHQ